jgi:hypothetical protein
MTAEGLLLLLEDMGVVLAPDQDGHIEYLTQDGELPPRLLALMRAYKPQLVALLRAREQGGAATCEAPAASLYRRWVTGQAPQGTYPLPAPTYHATPSAPVTYWGEACTKKACAASVNAAGQSQRFFPSDLCVSCWTRAEKRVTRDAQEGL